MPAGMLPIFGKCFYKVTDVCFATEWIYLALAAFISSFLWMHVAYSAFL